VPSSAPPAIHVDGATKTFRIPNEHVHTLKERVLHPFRRPGVRELHALGDVSFAVEQGEFFGIVGRNGSGKSTLLKCMAGIYAVDRGRIYVTGRLSSFIELGVGFNPDLAARDNVLLNGTMLGLSPREARRRVDEVIDFAELREFQDLKLKNYSSGMEVRLAFSVMIHVNADVLLIDEVLAVGDASFQQKCFDQFAALRRRGATVVLVTHDMGAAQRFCDRAMLLERGRMVETGAADHIAQRYLELNFGDGAPTPTDEANPEAGQRWGDGKARITDAWFEDADGARTEVLPTRTPCSHVMRVRFSEDAGDPVFSLIVEDQKGFVIMTADKGVLIPTGDFSAGDEVTVRTRFDNILAPGRYRVTPGVAHRGNVHHMDRPEGLQTLTVTGTRRAAGMVEVPFEVDVERTSSHEVAR
jgi:ABC-type polysaccharide/polyol phosphate transport system ATPase subunit